jgi:hypothetical protein
MSIEEHDMNGSPMDVHDAAAAAPAPSAPPASLATRLYVSVRDYAHERQPGLLRTVRRIRNLAVAGPLNEAVVRHFQGPNRPIVTNTAPVFPWLDPAAVAETLRRDGVCGGITISPSLAEEIVAEAGPETAIGPHRRCPSVRKVAENDKVVAVARHYLGTEPHLFESYVVWSPPVRHDYKQTFHFDVADFRAVALFVYLTDVDLASSPHQAVAGTHWPKSLRDIWNQELTDAAVEERYPGRVETFLGPRGTAFFEDQTVIHRALGGATKLRGALILNYTIRRRSSLR